MSTTTDAMVTEYLERLDAALAPMSSARRSQLLDEIAQHIAQEMSDLPDRSEAAMRNLLEKLGEPEAIAAEASNGESPRAVPDDGPGTNEIFAILLLLFGGFIFGVGWLVGIALLWRSQVWTRRDKLIGTFLLPGGLLFPLVGVVWLSWVVSQTGPDAARFLTFGIPVLTALYLYVRAKGKASRQAMVAGGVAILALVSLTIAISAGAFTDSKLTTDMGVPSPGAGEVVCPNVIGESQAQATAELLAADLRATIRTVASSGSPGIVQRESPEAGSFVNGGSQVRITVSSGAGAAS
jgi:hypothetical protein